MSITKITKILYFLGKRFSEMKEDDEHAIDSIAMEAKHELEKKDGFEIDLVYKEKVWREFYERGIVRNTIYIITFIFILIIYVPIVVCCKLKDNVIRIFKYLVKKAQYKKTPQETGQDNTE